MNNPIFYSAGHTAALTFAVNTLKKLGFRFAEISDATHLLLPVPSFDPEGNIKGGGELTALLEKLSDDVIVIGGNLDRPELAAYKTIDLLKDPFYISQNANITAHCAIKLAMNKLPTTLNDCPVLIIGWGRIGKCLATLLKALGADVTVAARKEADRAMLEALGYHTSMIESSNTESFRIIYNTAPAMVLPQCPGSALKIDLASRLGIGGLDVIWARGLPSKDAPESSGTLIADSVIRAVTGKENSK